MSEAAGVEAPSAGLQLRRAREAAGLHVAALAVALKVPVRKLEALEEDRYDLLPDAVFVRALASSVCRNLKIDPQPVLDRLPQTAAPRLVQTTDGINAPFRAPGDGPRPGWTEQLSRPVTLAVGALLLGALVLLLLPSFDRDNGQLGVRPDAAMPPGSPVTVTVAQAPLSASPADLPMSPASAPAPLSVAAAAPPAAAAVMPAAQPAVAVPAGVSSAPVPAAADRPPTAGVVVFRTKAPSWVQVVDAKGTTVLRRLMEGGETVGASGALPLSVIVGSAESTEVRVRGKSLDLAPMSRDNVARFEVK